MTPGTKDEWRQMARDRKLKLLQVSSLHDLGDTMLEVLAQLQHFGGYGVRIDSSADPLLVKTAPEQMKTVADALLNGRRHAYLNRSARARDAGVRLGRKKKTPVAVDTAPESE